MSDMSEMSEPWISEANAERVGPGEGDYWAKGCRYETIECGEETILVRSRTHGWTRIAQSRDGRVFATWRNTGWSEYPDEAAAREDILSCGE
jgi:hypothetical protein